MTYRRIRREDGNWDKLIEELGEFLVKNIPPYNLLSISLFEDAHPNDGNGINAVVTHTAGSVTKVQELSNYEL